MTALPGRQMFFRVPELAELTGIPAVTLRRLAKSGRLAHATITATDDSSRPAILITRASAEKLISDLAADAARSVTAAPAESRVRPITAPPKRGRTQRTA